MPTTTRSPAWTRFAATLLLGAVMAVSISVAGAGALAWLGFALAATMAPGSRGRMCVHRRSPA